MVRHHRYLALLFERLGERIPLTSSLSFDLQFGVSPDANFGGDGMDFQSNEAAVAADRPRPTIVTVPKVIGDFDLDGLVGANDIDLLFTEVNSGNHDLAYDLTADSLVTTADVDELVLNILGTQYGDANLDGRVSFADFTTLAQYCQQAGGWGYGDFSGNGEVDLLDLDRLEQHFGFDGNFLVTEDWNDAVERQHNWLYLGPPDQTIPLWGSDMSWSADGGRAGAGDGYVYTAVADTVPFFGSRFLAATVPSDGFGKEHWPGWEVGLRSVAQDVDFNNASSVSFDLKADANVTLDAGEMRFYILDQRDGPKSFFYTEPIISFTNGETVPADWTNYELDISTPSAWIDACTRR